MIQKTRPPRYTSGDWKSGETFENANTTGMKGLPVEVGMKGLPVEVTDDAEGGC